MALSRGLLVSVALLASLAMAAAANSTCANDALGGLLSVNGQGTVSLPPNMATISLTVTSTQPTAVEAQDEAANSTAAVLEAVGAVEGVSPEDITTVGVTLTAKYSRPDTNRESVIEGYTFSQQLQVKVLNLTSDVLSEAVDAAVQAGGNNLRISGIQTSLSDDMQAQAISKARTLAVQDALATAKVLGKASGVKVGPIRTITDQSAPRPQPVQFRAAADAVGGADVQSSNMISNIADVDVESSVALQLEVCNPTS